MINKINICNKFKGAEMYNNKKILFEINPLDINLAKMQLNLIKRIDNEVPEYGLFAPIEETYTSKDKTRDLSEVKIICTHKKDANNKQNNIRSIVTECSNRTNGNLYRTEIFSGTKKKLIDYINTPKIFETCKGFIIENKL